MRDDETSPPTLGQPAAASAIPPDVPPYLLECVVVGDDPSAFRVLLEALCAALKPRNIVDFLPIKCIADAVWAERRLQHMRDATLANRTGEKLQQIIATALREQVPSPPLRAEKAAEITRQFMNGQPQVQSAVTEILKEAGTSIDLLTAQAFTQSFDNHMKFDALLRGQARMRQAGGGEFAQLRRLMREEEERAMEKATLEAVVDHPAPPSGQLGHGHEDPSSAPSSPASPFQASPSPASPPSAPSHAGGSAAVPAAAEARQAAPKSTLETPDPDEVAPVPSADQDQAKADVPMPEKPMLEMELGAADAPAGRG
jgi:hypothetical protein